MQTKPSSLPLSHGRFTSLGVAALVISGVAMVPVITVLWSLFTPGAGGAHLWEVTLWRYVRSSGLLMLLVGAGTVVIGTGTAWAVSAIAFPGRRMLSLLLILPLAMPAYLVCYLYADLLAFAGPIQSGLREAFGWQAGSYWFPALGGVGGAAFILMMVLYPYVYLLARSAFAAQSRAQFMAARSLGAGPGRAFWRVALPGARPAIAGGLALVLMETLADFGVADYLGLSTFSTGIFRIWFGMEAPVTAMKLAAVLLLFVLVLVGVESASRRGSVASDDRLSAHPPLIRPGPLGQLTAFLVCSLPVVIGFGIPAGLLVSFALDQIPAARWDLLWRYAGNSVLIAVIVAVLSMVTAFILAYAARSGGRVSRAAVMLATLGYALPGALLAVGLRVPLAPLDQAMTRWSREMTGLDHGLILTGTLVVLAYALIIRFLTVSYNSLSSGMTRVSPQMDAAARSLGADPVAVARRIHLPLLRPSLAAGLSLVFIDVLRELPATLVLRPGNFETLATRVYRLAKDARLEEASLAALMIVLAGLLPVLLLGRLRK